jgi:hypothetical protein
MDNIIDNKAAKEELKVDLRYIEESNVQVSVNGKSLMTIYCDALYNCQLFVLGGASYVLSRFNVEECIEIFKECAFSAEKRQVLIDIETHQASKAKEVFGVHNLIIENCYKNGTRNHMCIMMFAVHEWLEWSRFHEEEDDEEYTDEDESGEW